MRLNARGSVRSRLPQFGQYFAPSFCGSWSSRWRALHDLQSTIGSLKVASWPLAFHTARFMMIEPSMPTMSSRSRTLRRHQKSFRLRFSSTPIGP